MTGDLRSVLGLRASEGHELLEELMRRYTWANRLRPALHVVTAIHSRGGRAEYGDIKAELWFWTPKKLLAGAELAERLGLLRWDLPADNHARWHELADPETLHASVLWITERGGGRRAPRPPSRPRGCHRPGRTDRRQLLTRARSAT